MGKLKKQTKASRARRLQAAEFHQDVDMDDTRGDMIDEEEPDNDAEDAGSTSVSVPKGESMNKMRQRQHEEWKKVREEIEKIKAQRRKIRKSDPDGQKKRKELADRAKWLQVQYQDRVEKERANCKPRAVQKAEEKEEEESALRTELAQVREQMEQIKQLLIQQQQKNM